MGLANPMWEQFCVLVATGMKPGDAYQDLNSCQRKTALNAGNRLMRRADIKARIREIHAKTESQAIHKNVMTKDWFTRKLKNVIEHCSEIIQTETRSGTVDQMRDPTNAIRGIELGGREIGMFARVTKKQPEGDPLEGMTYEEMLKLSKRADEEIARHARKRDEHDGRSGATAGASTDSEGDGEAPPSDVPPLQ